MRKPRLTEELLRKLEFIEDNKGPDGWTDSPVEVAEFSYHPVILGVPYELFTYHPSGTKVRLNRDGRFLLGWCR